MMPSKARTPRGKSIKKVNRQDSVTMRYILKYISIILKLIHAYFLNPENLKMCRTYPGAVSHDSNLPFWVLEDGLIVQIP